MMHYINEGKYKNRMIILNKDHIIKRNEMYYEEKAFDKIQPIYNMMKNSTY